MHEFQLADQRFALIAVNRKLISRQAYYNVLKQQKRLYAQTKEYTLIGDILLNQGDIKEDQRDHFLTFSVEETFCPFACILVYSCSDLTSILEFFLALMPSTLASAAVIDVM